MFERNKRHDMSDVFLFCHENKTIERDTFWSILLSSLKKGGFMNYKAAYIDGIDKRFAVIGRDGEIYRKGYVVNENNGCYSFFTDGCEMWIDIDNSKTDKKLREHGINELDEWLYNHDVSITYNTEKNVYNLKEINH